MGLSIWRCPHPIFFFFQAEDGIRDADVTGVQTCALPIYGSTTAGPMWYDAMKVIQQWLPDATFTPPNGTDVNGVLTTVPDVSGQPYGQAAKQLTQARSEERRVGKECRWRGAAEREKKKRE